MLFATAKRPFAPCRFVAYLDDSAPPEAEITVWSEHHIAEGDQVGVQTTIADIACGERGDCNVHVCMRASLL